MNYDLMMEQKMYYTRRRAGMMGEIPAIYNGNPWYTPIDGEYPQGLPPQIALSEAYKYFLSELKAGRRFNHFYKQLQTLRRDILLDIKLRNQASVANDLQMTAPKFSAIVQMLSAMDEVQYHVSSINA